jgi:ATP-dependent protease Clp ATPase subunit
VWRTRNPKRDAVCTFCGHPPSEVAKLIAGPNVFICDGCVGKAERDLRVAPTKGRCAFCGKRRDVATRADGSACAECLTMCREILDQRSTQ